MLSRALLAAARAPRAPRAQARALCAAGGAPYEPEPQLGPGAAGHVTVGYYRPGPGSDLDSLLAAYKEHAFDPLLEHEDFLHGTLALDRANGRLVSITTWTSFDACRAALLGAPMAPHLQAMMAELADAPAPEYMDLPVSATTS